MSYTRIMLGGVPATVLNCRGPTANLSGGALAVRGAATVVIRHARDALGTEALFQGEGREDGVGVRVFMR